MKCDGEECRLIVSWQRLADRQFFAVGVLTYSKTDQYEFAYLKDASAVAGFLPLLGFSDFHHRYRSSTLFPIFAGRVMDPKRPDRVDWLRDMGLSPAAGPMEVLARSGGVRQGDRLELTPEPKWSKTTGETESVFLAHGVRHHKGAQERIARLRHGDVLLLEERPDNPVNKRALVVTADDALPLGWVPDPLLNFVREVRSQAARLIVETANPSATDPHLQLVVRLTGRISYEPFSGPEWITAA